MVFAANLHKRPLDSLPCHSLSGSAIEYNELEGPPSAHIIGISSHLASGLHDRDGGALPDQASTVSAWRGSLSKRDPHFFKESLS
jgi:hypothetical protein